MSIMLTTARDDDANMQVALEEKWMDDQSR